MAQLLQRAIIQLTYNQTSDLCIVFSIRVNNRRVRLDIFVTTQNLRPREDLKIIMTLDVLDSSFASDEDIREDYPETTLAHIEASPSNDETDIDDDSTADQFHNFVLFAQQRTGQTVERDHGGRGTLASDTVTDHAVQEGQAAKFPPNCEEYLVEQRLRHVGYRRLRVLKQQSDY